MQKYPLNLKPTLTLFLVKFLFRSLFIRWLKTKRGYTLFKLMIEAYNMEVVYCNEMAVIPLALVRNWTTTYNSFHLYNILVISSGTLMCCIKWLIQHFDEHIEHMHILWYNSEPHELWDLLFILISIIFILIFVCLSKSPYFCKF